MAQLGRLQKGMTLPTNALVVYLPGFGFSGGEWVRSPIRESLQRQGYETVTFHTDRWQGDIANSGVELKKFVDYQQADHTLVVAHSMGGLIARSADATGAAISAVATLGTPHSGSFSALWWTAAGSQMMPGSQFLHDLNRRAHRARYLAVSARYDSIALNASLGPLRGTTVTNVTVGGDHLDLPNNPEIIQHISEFFFQAVHEAIPHQQGRGIASSASGRANRSDGQYLGN